MTNEKFTDYQYNKCTSRGICSINPATASLQEVILLYLKYAAYYGLKLQKCGKKDIKIRNLVLNTMSLLGSNYEISETNFEIINSAFKTELPRIIKEVNKICPEEELFDSELLLHTDNSIKDYIQYGEKEFNRRVKNMKPEERNLFRMLFVLVKSLCINILTYESFGCEAEDEILLVFNALNLFNSVEKTQKELKDFITEISEKDCHLMNKISLVREEKYGKQEESEISFSTTQGKAVLVVGSNIRELEQILDVFEGKNIDIYTHDNMIIAHTFPKFKTYKHLKGQFGQGMENCLLDFSTFPGPIILTRYSLFNVENLYRGRLFTTDFSYSKGVIPIKNNDFSEVLKSAETSKGFKSGKICESEYVGFSVNKIISTIKDKLSNNNYSNVIVIGLGGYSAAEREYFKIFLKHIPKDVLVISALCCESEENVICVKASGDTYGICRLVDEISNICNHNLTFFYPYSDRHTLSSIIHSTKYKNSNVFIGTWNQMVISPDIAEGLKSEFSVTEAISPKNDMNKIFNVK